MNSRATADFWDCYARLPEKVQERARTIFRLWLKYPYHPSLHFKRVKSGGEDVWSVRVGIHWRALGLRDSDTIVWFWIGSHADYDRLIG
jgi:hypothetical protein